MTVGVEPEPSPYGPEGLALGVVVSGVVVLNAAVGLQGLWLLALLVVMFIRPLTTLPGLRGFGGAHDADGGGGDSDNSDGDRGGNEAGGGR